MAVYKCKMCGGSLDVREGAAVCECDYCGSKQTVPANTDENTRSLYNRANTLRLRSEFDKAEELYEKILEMNSTDSEAYWGLILCRYGVEYVEDPRTMKRVPTCHRTSYEAVTADEDYKNAVYYASAEQKAIYEAEAKTIDEIQKGIIAISRKEDPYDVFICYKETDENGKRTPDSVIANDIYYQLTQQGYKVFYSAITLEDKLGSEYEPYIFSALNTAKVMLVIGTKPEYFNAVWVKNEWSRFLKIMKKDRSRLLIPCFRDMDAYELPEDFAHLQAQDMSKIGFINDVARGIGKVIVKEKTKTPVNETAAGEGTAVNIAPLLRRAAMFLEDGEWDRADEICEQVLNADPENAQAYVYKLMGNEKVFTQSGLADCASPFDNNKNYQKALRFASPELRRELESSLSAARERYETLRKDGIYNDAFKKMRNSSTEQEFIAVAGLLESISGWKNADKLREEALAKAEKARKKKLYDQAITYSRRGDSNSISQAIDILKSLEGFGDSDNRIREFSELLQRTQEKEAAETRERQRREELRRQYNEEFKDGLQLAKKKNILESNYKTNRSLWENAEKQSSGGLFLFLSIIMISCGLVIFSLGSPELGAGVIAIGCIEIFAGIKIAANKRKSTDIFKKTAAEIQEQLDRIKAVPTFEEYIKAHKE